MLFVCLPILLLVSSSIQCCGIPLLTLESTLQGLNINWMPEALQKSPRPFVSNWDCRDIQPFRLNNDWILKLSCVRVIIEYSHPHPVRQSNKSPFKIHLFIHYQFCSLREPGFRHFPFLLSSYCPCPLLLTSPAQMLLVFNSATDVYLKC